jgi:hypothetical protein
MGHWAKIEDNQVTQVVVADDDKHDWLTDTLGGQWVQTSYNTSGGVHYTDGEPSADQTKALRGNYAGVGFTYLADEDIFMPPKPYDSWVLNVDCACWEAPIPKPEDGGNYTWDEATTDWLEVVAE